jgi:predicted Zn-dependent protease
VEKGVFIEHVHDLASAAACGTSSTGSAGANPGEMPVPVCTNLALETGPSDLAGLMAGAEGGILVAELLPGGSGNVLEGVFRIPVAAAFSISGGRAAAPLRAGCCLEGNALDLFRRISDVEDTLYGVGTDRLPHVIVDGLTLGTI